jgi:cytoskeletal protein RodZ
LGSFGEKLRKQREERGIALDAISKTTKISTRMLRALEDEHFDQLPGGVFNKGFVRAYARQVGLDAEEAISDYLAALRESQIQSQNILPDFRKPADVPAPGPSQSSPRNPDRKTGKDGDQDPQENHLRKPDLTRQNVSGNGGSNDRLQADRRKQDRRNQARSRQGRSNKKEDAVHANRSALPMPAAEIHPESSDKVPGSIPWGKLAAALLVVSAVLAFWNLRRQSHLTAASTSSAPSNPAPSAVAPAPPAVPSQQESVAAGSLKGSSKMDQPRASRAMLAATMPSGTSAPTVATHTSTTLPTVAEPPSAKSAAVRATSEPGSTASPPTAKAAVHTPVVKPPSTFTLLVRAEKTTWVTITADGKPVTQETLIAPAHTSVRASREIVVKTGNAGGISFVLSGKEIPAQGLDGEARTYIFDGSGMKVSAGESPNTAR